MIIYNAIQHKIMNIFHFIQFHCNETQNYPTLRRGRDHSLGGTGTGSTLGRTPSLRESSLTRGGRGARDTDR